MSKALIKSSAIALAASQGRCPKMFNLPGMEFKSIAFDKADDDGAQVLETLGEVKSTIEGINTTFEEFKKKNDERLSEIEKKGSADTLLEEQLTKMNEVIEDQQKSLDAFGARVRRMSMYGGGEGNNESEEDLEAKADLWGKIDAKSFGAEGSEDYKAEAMKEYGKKFVRYLRKGEKVLDADEFKALSVGGDPDGGYVVMPDMSGRIVGRVFETSPVRQFASVQTIGTDALEGLRDQDEVGFGWVGETGTRPQTDTAELGKYRIPVHEMYAAPFATQKILDDAAINIEAWLSGKVADRFSRAENAAFATGTGSNQPRGFLTYPNYASPGVFENGAIERFNTGVNGGFAAAPNGGDILIDAIYGLKAQYRQNAVWFMSRGTTGAVRKIKDSDGAYLWQPGIAAGQPATVLGYPQASFEDMPEITTGSLSIAVGDMGETYQIVDRLGIRTLRDPYSNKPYVEFYSTKRVGGDVINFESLKLVEFSA